MSGDVFAVTAQQIRFSLFLNLCALGSECFPILKAALLDFLVMSNVSKSYTTSTINSTPQSGVVVS